MLTIGSLFSGIGGLELGLERAGLGPVLWQVEIDPFCRRVLEKHWPDVERFEDVRRFPDDHSRNVDLLCGGFPCQDISSGNPKGRGLSGARSGLWYEFERVVFKLNPTWVVIENTAGNARRWVETIGQRLEEQGYQTFPVQLEARYVGAPHRRGRIFVIAHTNRHPLRDLKQWMSTRWPERVPIEGQTEFVDIGRREPGSPVPRADDGLPHRMDRIRALGNAVVPQCAEVIGHIVKELHSLNPQ